MSRHKKRKKTHRDVAEIAREILEQIIGEKLSKKRRSRIAKKAAQARCKKQS